MAIAVIGPLDLNKEAYNLHSLTVLIEVLEKFYGSEHEVIVYEAAVYPVCRPVIQHVMLARLLEAHITVASTLYIPPIALAPLDGEMLGRLGIALDMSGKGVRNS